MAGFVGLDGLLGGVLSGLFGIGQQAMANSFAMKEAAKDRDFQSAEAEKNRDFQSDEAAAQRDWSSQENELNRLFNANEAALQRDWSAAEAEQARDWQEEMYAKYNSLSGKISQAEQAGVNPMFAITGNAVTPMSASSPMPSGSAASGSMSGGASASGSAASGSRASAGLVNILGGILDGMKLKSEIELNESQAAKNYSEAEESRWKSKLSEREFTIITENDFDIQEIESRIGLNHDNALSAYNLALKYFEEAGKIAEEKDFLAKTSSDRQKIVEYEKLVAEFESSLSSSLDNISTGQESTLKEWFGSILKIILAFKK